MRWPWRRDRDSSDAGTTPSSPAPSPMGWAFLPPLQRMLDAPATPIIRPHEFPHELSAWRNPSFGSPSMTHLVSVDAPAGVIDGDGAGSIPAAPVQRVHGAPDLTLLPPPRPATPRPVARTRFTSAPSTGMPAVQRRVVPDAPLPVPVPAPELAVEAPAPDPILEPPAAPVSVSVSVEAPSPGPPAPGMPLQRAAPAAARPEPLAAEPDAPADEVAGVSAEDAPPVDTGTPPDAPPVEVAAADLPAAPSMPLQRTTASDGPIPVRSPLAGPDPDAGRSGATEVAIPQPLSRSAEPPSAVTSPGHNRHAGAARRARLELGPPLPAVPPTASDAPPPVQRSAQEPAQKPAPPASTAQVQRPTVQHSAEPTAPTNGAPIVPAESPPAERPSLTLPPSQVQRSTDDETSPGPAAAPGEPAGPPAETPASAPSESAAETVEPERDEPTPAPEPLPSDTLEGSAEAPALGDRSQLADEPATEPSSAPGALDAPPSDPPGPGIELALQRTAAPVEPARRSLTPEAGPAARATPEPPPIADRATHAPAPEPPASATAGATGKPTDATTLNSTMGSSEAPALGDGPHLAAGQPVPEPSTPQAAVPRPDIELALQRSVADEVSPAASDAAGAATDPTPGRGETPTLGDGSHAAAHAPMPEATASPITPEPPPTAPPGPGTQLALQRSADREASPPTSEAPTPEPRPIASSVTPEPPPTSPPGPGIQLALQRSADSEASPAADDTTVLAEAPTLGDPPQSTAKTPTRDPSDPPTGQPSAAVVAPEAALTTRPGPALQLTLQRAAVPTTSTQRTVDRKAETTTHDGSSAVASAEPTAISHATRESPTLQETTTANPRNGDGSAPETTTSGRTTPGSNHFVADQPVPESNATSVTPEAPRATDPGPGIQLALQRTAPISRATWEHPTFQETPTSNPRSGGDSGPGTTISGRTTTPTHHFGADYPTPESNATSVTPEAPRATDPGPGIQLALQRTAPIGRATWEHPTFQETPTSNPRSVGDSGPGTTISGRTTPPTHHFGADYPTPESNTASIAPGTPPATAPGPGIQLALQRTATAGHATHERPTLQETPAANPRNGGDSGRGTTTSGRTTARDNHFGADYPAAVTQLAPVQRAWADAALPGTGRARPALGAARANRTQPPLPLNVPTADADAVQQPDDAQPTAEATTAPVPALPVVESTVTAAAPEQAPAQQPAPDAAQSTEDIEALAQRLMAPLLRRLRAELLVERERRGVRTDAWRTRGR